MIYKIKDKIDFFFKEISTGRKTSSPEYFNSLINKQCLNNIRRDPR